MEKCHSGSLWPGTCIPTHFGCSPECTRCEQLVYGLGLKCLFLGILYFSTIYTKGKEIFVLNMFAIKLVAVLLPRGCFQHVTFLQA